jgi:hypothetical protein
MQSRRNSKAKGSIRAFSKLLMHPPPPVPTLRLPSPQPKPQKPSPLISSAKETEGYCELSIVYTNDDSFPEKLDPKPDANLILDARRSLIDLQMEAKDCLLTSRKILNEAKFRSSCVIPDRAAGLQNSYTQEMLRNLSQSVAMLSKRLSTSEMALSQRNEENQSLKDELKEIQNRINRKECSVESQAVRSGCTAECVVM